MTSQVTFHSVILSDKKRFSAYQGKLWASDISVCILLDEELDEEYTQAQNNQDSRILITSNA